MASVAISMRRRGMIRLARRKFDLRLAVFGSMVLLHLPVKGAAAQERIVFLLLQATWCIEAFFVTRSHVTGNRLAFRFGLCALNSDDIPGHGG